MFRDWWCWWGFEFIFGLSKGTVRSRLQFCLQLAFKSLPNLKLYLCASLCYLQTEKKWICKAIWRAICPSPLGRSEDFEDGCSFALPNYFGFILSKVDAKMWTRRHLSPLCVSDLMSIRLSESMCVLFSESTSLPSLVLQAAYVTMLICCSSSLLKSSENTLWCLLFSVRRWEA